MKKTIILTDVTHEGIEPSPTKISFLNSWEPRLFYACYSHPIP